MHSKSTLKERDVSPLILICLKKEHKLTNLISYRVSINKQEGRGYLFRGT